MRIQHIILLFISISLVSWNYTSKPDVWSTNCIASPVYVKDSISTYIDSARTLGFSNGLAAIGLANRAIELSILTNNTWGEASGYAALAQIQQSMNQVSLASDNYAKSISAFTRMSNRNSYDNAQLSNAYFEFCTILIHQNRLNEAQVKLNAIAADIWKGFSESDKRRVNRIKAGIFVKQRLYTDASSILDPMLLESKASGDSKGICETQLALGDLLLAQNDKTRAEYYYLEAKKTAENSGNREGLIQANASLATFYGLNNDLDRELSMRNANIAFNQESNNYQAISEDNYQIGNAYFNNDRLVEAENYYGKLLEPNLPNSTENAHSDESSQRIQLTPLQYRSAQLEQGSNAFRQLAESYFKKNDLQKALDNFKKYTQIQDSIRDVHKKELDEAIAISNTLGKNEQRISLLEKERILSNRSLEILQMDKTLQQGQLFNRNLIIGVLAFFLVFITGGGAYLIRSARARRKADKLLALQSLSGQMNPHFIFNALNSVNEYISLNDERSANRYLSEFSKLMRRVMDDSRHTFIPFQEEIEMLRIYLQLEHSRFKNIFEYNLEIPEISELSEFEIPPMIVQPYLENAIWHGLRYRNGGGLLSIRFESKRDSLCITIEDNGIGIRKSKELKTKNQKKQNSLGMKNIETRVELMNDIYHRNIDIQIMELNPADEFPGTRVVIIIPQQLNQHSN
ncbi:MAG: histidine kinase [Flavobacteriales bacterium]